MPWIVQCSNSAVYNATVAALYNAVIVMIKHYIYVLCVVCYLKYVPGRESI